ncbi:MAG: hypothetical protein AAFN17_06750 [Pseudomonadota bacterium]
MADTSPKTALAALTAVLVLSGCASDFITETPVSLTAGPDPLAPGQATAPKSSPAEILAAAKALLPAPGETLAYTLCEADRETGLCDEDPASLKAFGVGGLLLPLVMEVRGLEFKEVATDDDGNATFETDFDVTVNLIPPLCPDADGQFVLSEAAVLTMDFDAFYCNWAVIGNVVNQFDFSIDTLDVETRSFTGSYALQFNGTGNAAGTGYFRAFPAPAEVEDEPDALAAR